MTDQFRDILALKKESLKRIRTELRTMLEPSSTEDAQQLTPKERAGLNVVWGAIRMIRSTALGLSIMIDEMIGHSVKDELINKMTRPNDDE